jgi:hypothetical protein
LFATIPAQCKALSRVDASVGASGPHDFAVRLTRHSSKAPKRPPHPAPTFSDDRETPLVQGHGTAAKMKVIWAKREAKYFSQGDWTGSISLIGFDKFAFWRKGIGAEQVHNVRPSGVSDAKGTLCKVREGPTADIPRRSTSCPAQGIRIWGRRTSGGLCRIAPAQGIRALA